MPDWKAREGELLDGKHPLERYLGGDPAGGSAIYLTRSGAAAIRIRRVDPAQAAEVVGRWNRAKRFPHPHLIRIEDAGTADLAGEPVAYLVTEHAEENLADVLQTRSLTPDETRAMLLPVATALDYLHRRGMAHGDLKPSNILAVGDTVKLSSESVAEGDPADDIHALGRTLTDALAARADLPPPFDRIAAGCLDPDPTRRWTADRVVSRLQPLAARPARRRLAAPIGLAAAITIGIVGGMMLRRTDTPPPAVSQPRPAPATVVPAPSPSPPAPPPAPPPRSIDKTESTRDRLVMEDGIARRVTPNVPAKARQTITGRPSVVVRVTVDPAGNVTGAALERSFSPYFGKFALDAARQWKFLPDERATPRQWTLRFQFTPTDTRVVAAPTR